MKVLYEYTPHIGFGPFKFGMSPDDVHEILGEPAQVTYVLDFLDPQYVTESDLPFLEGLFGEDFLVGEDADNNRPSFSYDKTGVVEIILMNKKQKISYLGIDLFGSKRKEIMRELAKHEDSIFVNREGYYFSKPGIMLPPPGAWRNQEAVTFVKNEYVMNRLEFDDWEELNELDF